MDKLKRLFDRELGPSAERTEIDEFPIKVAIDWDCLVTRANAMSEVIDRHLEFESKLQGRELSPITLCPEQRVSLVSDLSAV